MHAGAVHVHPVHWMAVMGGAAKHRAGLLPVGKSPGNDRQWQSQQNQGEDKGLEALRELHSAIFM